MTGSGQPHSCLFSLMPDLRILEHIPELRSPSPFHRTPFLILSPVHRRNFSPMRVLFHSSKGGAQQPLGILHKWSLGEGNRGLRLLTVLQSGPGRIREKGGQPVLRASRNACKRKVLRKEPRQLGARETLFSLKRKRLGLCEWSREQGSPSRGDSISKGPEVEK